MRADLPCPLQRVIVMRKEYHLLAGLCLRVLYHEQAVAPSSFGFAADPLPAGSSR